MYCVNFKPMNSNNLTQKLLENLWNEKYYHNQAREFILKSFAAKDEFLLKLKKYSLGADTILECGCGSASILEQIWQKEKKLYGIDVSNVGINLAKRRLKKKANIKLSVANAGKLPFKDNSFGLVYATTVVEHLAHPEKAIREMIRVTKKNGHLILMSPNFGSPLFPSPCQYLKPSSYFSRFIKIFLKSHLYLLVKPKNLDWARVYPRVLREGKYQSDWDTISEPYLQTLIIFLKNGGCEILESYSTLQVLTSRVPRELPGNSLSSYFFHLVFRTVSLWVEKAKIVPYCYFGPNMFVAAGKG